MTSEHKLAANRRNALKSTGPVTTDGKQKSAKNALKHGLSAARIELLGNQSNGPALPIQLLQITELQIVECRRMRSELIRTLLRHQSRADNLVAKSGAESQATLDQLLLSLRYEREWLRRRALLV